MAGYVTYMIWLALFLGLSILLLCVRWTQIALGLATRSAVVARANAPHATRGMHRGHTCYSRAKWIK
jgi:hypothetical protein